MYQSLLDKSQPLAVLGLGYVGLPLALAFAKKIRVIGFDINAKRIEQMRQKEDPSRELPPEAFEGCDIQFSADIEDLRAARFYVLAVPTPINAHKQPELKPLLSACQTLSKVLKKGDCVVFESTVYPGCTEEDCVPILEEGSGLRFGVDFSVGYSPERINPGDKVHTLEKIVKVVSGNDAESLDLVAKVYELIIEAGVYRASSIAVAEAAKVIENTQRDLNIALMNELSLIFDRMGISTKDVLAAAGTKWNFLPFYPGLVGGHCIGVDPYYLTHKAQELGYQPEVILSGRRINDNMAKQVATRAVQILLKMGKELQKARILILGVTFKENVSDIRNSKVADLYQSLLEFSLQVDICDPLADSHEVEEEYGFALQAQPQGSYDAIVLAVSHEEYKALGKEGLQKLMQKEALLLDLKGLYPEAKDWEGMHYWAL